MTPESPCVELARPKAESEAAFRRYRATLYRRLTGELKTDRTLDAAREDMEAALIAAANAYRKLRGAGG
jgi:hypothetical protein